MDLVGAGVDQLHVIPGITRPPWKRTCGKLNQRLRIASASSALNATMKPSMTSRACLTAVSIASEVIQVIVPLIAGKFEALFNHLVCTREQRWRNGETKRSRRFEVDHRFVPGWRLYWQV